MRTRKIKSNAMIFCVGLLLLIFSQNISTVFAQSQQNGYLKVGDYMEYGFNTTEAYIPYNGGNLYLNVTNMTDPNNILIDIVNSSDNSVLSSNVPAGYFILNNNTLNSNYTECPLHNVTDSEIVAHWKSSNLSNVSQVYNQVERNGLQLNYTLLTHYNDDNDLYNLSVKWVWDYQTGVLLNMSVYFNDLNKSYLSGYFEQYLSDTSVFKLNTSNHISGFLFQSLIPAFGIGVIYIYLKHLRKSKKERKTFRELV